MAAETFTGIVAADAQAEDGERVYEPAGGVRCEFTVEGVLTQARFTVEHEDGERTEYVVPAYYILRAYNDIKAVEAPEHVPPELMEEREEYQPGPQGTEYEIVS